MTREHLLRSIKNVTSLIELILNRCWFKSSVRDDVNKYIIFFAFNVFTVALPCVSTGGTESSGSCAYDVWAIPCGHTGVCSPVPSL